MNPVTTRCNQQRESANYLESVVVGRDILCGLVDRFFLDIDDPRTHPNKTHLEGSFHAI